MNTIQLQMDNNIYAAFGNYAAQKKTTVQQLLMNYIYQIVPAAESSAAVPPVVSRLCGCAQNTLDAGDINGREAYYEHLTQKHE